MRPLAILLKVLVLFCGLLFFATPGQAAPFACEGNTITTGNEITVELETLTCGTTYVGTEEIEILNNGIISGSTIQVLLAFYNGATATVSGGTSGNGSGTFLSPECDTSVGCTLTVTGTHSTGAFTFEVVFPGSNSTTATLQNTNSGAVFSPEIAVSETGQGQGAIADGGTLAQGTQTAGSAVNLTFTVTNSGSGDLTIATATSNTLTNVTVNSISAPGSTTVTSGGGTTTFTVQYTPTLAGAFSFNLSFVNDDSDENPYNFTISGTATGTPEIAVAETGQGQGAVADGGTLAQGSQTAGSALTLTFTVTNSGTDDLTLATATSSSLTNVTVNSISAPGSTTVTGGGGTTTFTVQYTPTLAGAFSFGLSFTNNDSDENPYNFTVSGTATGAPEIAVSETGQGQGAVADGGTLAQGTQTAASALTLTFTVTNSGTDTLTIATATSSSPSNVTVNSISAPGSTSVTAGGGTTTFTVQYTPTVAGAFSFGLSFVNDDADENPYNFTVSGTATGAPEIAVAETGLGQGAIADGGTLAQGSRAAGSAVMLTFTVSNSGTGDLTIATATSNSLTNVTVNSISAPGSTTVTSGGGTTTFTVQYTPTLAGAFSFGLSFTNDDGDENPYNFTLSGTATGAPEIAVAETGEGQGAIADGGTLAQGTQTAGSALTLTFTVTNSGTRDLTLATATSASPTNVTVNSISAPASTTVTGGGTTTTFTVQYSPTIAGGFSFDVSFTNNDADENPYNFTVSGTATGAPEIAVAETGLGQGAVADGGTLAQGSHPIGSAVTLTFTTTNSGTDTLSVSTATSSSASNVTVDSISAHASSTVAPSGGTTTFTVQYTPTIAGGYSFDLSFANTDADENPYNFTVSGNGSASPEIDVQRPAASSIADGDTDAQGNIDTLEQQTLTYTVVNSGTTTLTLVGTPTSSNTSNVTVDSISAPGSTALAASASTTFTVSYTVQAAGAFSFDLDIVSNDADETTYDITVSGNGQAAPDISVSSSTSGTLNDGGTDGQGGVATGVQQQLSYTIVNNSGGVLTLSTTPTITGTNNVTVNSVSDITASSSSAFLDLDDILRAAGNLIISTAHAAPGTISLDPNQSATFSVSYTPQSGGAFAFVVNIASNDPNSSNFNVTVNGTAGGNPEIEVSSAINGNLASGGSDPQGVKSGGVSTTATYTISNTGLDTLNLTTPTVATNVTATTNATVTGFSLGATSLAAGGGSTTLVVTYTPGSSGAFSFSFNFANTDSNENPYRITTTGNSASGTASLFVRSGSGQAAEVNTAFAAPLVAEIADAAGNPVAGVSVTFTAPASGPSLVFAGSGTASETVLTDASGFATSSTMTANATASTYIGGGSLDSYAVVASATGYHSASFSLTNNRESAADIARTKEVIATFVTNRANLIVSEQPNLVNRLRGGPFGRQSNLNGFAFNFSPGSQQANFQFSLLAFMNRLETGSQGSSAALPAPRSGPDPLTAFAALQRSPSLADDENTSDAIATSGVAGSYGTAPGQSSPAPATSRSGFDIWAQGTYAKSENGNNDSMSGLFFAGIDYRYRNAAVFGFMAELDITDQSNTPANTAADGVGWMAGPYAVLRLHQNLYADARATYGQSYNRVNALGLFYDDFETDRVLLQGGLTGDFDFSPFTFNPFAKLTYFWEQQRSYTDTLGNRIPNQSFDLGRLEFGPEVTVSFQSEGGVDTAFHLSISGVYDFNSFENDTPSDPTLASADEAFRARLEGGAAVVLPGRNIQIKGEGFYDGVGVPDFKAYGGTLAVRIPF